MPTKPISVKITSPAPTLADAAALVRSSPYTIHGWRPTSVTTQPASLAMYGNGIINSNSHSMGGVENSRPSRSSRTAPAVTARKIVPSPTMTW